MCRPEQEEKIKLNMELLNEAMMHRKDPKHFRELQKHGRTMGINMNFSNLEKYGCKGIIADKFFVVYDEAGIAICRKDGKLFFSINELQRLIKILQQAETEMLENYKNMTLDEKIEFCKVHDINYSTIQKIITLKENNEQSTIFK